MKIRPHEPDELADVLALVGEAFVDEPVVVDLVRDLVSDAAFMPEFSLVAEDDDGLVGYVLLTRAAIVADEGHRSPWSRSRRSGYALPASAKASEARSLPRR